MDGTQNPGDRDKRLRQSDRRDQHLPELKPRPHVRISEMTARLGVSTEAAPRDMDKLSEIGLIVSAHGGAPASGHHPDVHHRSRDRRKQRTGGGPLRVDSCQIGDFGPPPGGPLSALVSVVTDDIPVTEMAHVRGQRDGVS